MQPEAACFVLVGEVAYAALRIQFELHFLATGHRGVLFQIGHVFLHSERTRWQPALSEGKVSGVSGVESVPEATGAV